LTASPWIVRWAHLVPSRGTVLDVACGGGRHAQWFSERGYQVTGIDLDTAQAQAAVPAAHFVGADIEAHAWPLVCGGKPQTFDAVVVTNYLWRPLMDTLVGSVAEGGVLLYETFTAGNESVGRPSRPDFLLQAGELLHHCQNLHVVAYENGYLEHPPRFVQRIAAVRMPTGGASPLNPKRHPL
jgi:SAM-dependent methyltransferase